MTLADAQRLFQQQRFDDARRIARALIKNGQQMGGALQLLGFIEGRVGQFDAAVRHLQESVRYAPTAVESWYFLGVALSRLGRHEAAVEALQQAVALAPGLFQAQHDLGLALHALSRHAEASVCFEAAVALEPGSFEAWLNRGINLGKLRRYDDERASYERALALDDGHESLLENLGQVLMQLGEHARAAAHYERLVARFPGHATARGAWVHARMRCCDWHGLPAQVELLRSAIAAGQQAMPPFAFASLPATAAEQLVVAQRFSAQFAVAPAPPPRARGDRLRIGYLSSDYRQHPVAAATVRMFELHDRRRFEVIGVSIAARDSGPLRRRLEAAFDRFVDADGWPADRLVQVLREMEIDILIDLNGYTEHARPEVLAARPAPLQIAWLGFPGTSGAPSIDYVVADATLIAQADRVHYAEQVITLPDTYMATDPTRPAGDGDLPSRAEAGLPAQGFVFCAFHNAYKIAPDVFLLWLRLLKGVPGSVLWLSLKSPAQQANLQAEAQREGVAPQRLVFAPFVDAELHARRLRLADLFLDTWPYNAHATAVDVLWAGVPLLTCRGATFASRVAASLLQAAGLPELITASPADYEAMALRLATDAEVLQRLRERATAARSSVLFDAERFTRHFERGLQHAWQRQQDGLPPAHIRVD